MPDRPTITARAHAKVNLALAVGPPVPEGDPHAGYHPIRSWMHAVDLHDDIRIARRPEGACSRHEVVWERAGSARPEPAREDNLVVRAHRALERDSGRALPAQMCLTKRIPVGGGMGGGSSDAAVTLLALNDLFELGADEPTLHRIGAMLGSDVAFFIDLRAWREGLPPRPAVVSGVGETVERLDRRTERVTLICPDFGCETRAVYRAFDDDPSERLDGARVDALARAGDPDWRGLFNDLASPAGRVEPRLNDLLGTLGNHGPGAWHVSGSGSTVFAVDAPPPSGVVPEEWIVETRLV